VEIDLTLDCRDAARIASFWKLALRYEDERPPSGFRTREDWLRHYEVPEDEWSDGAWLHDPKGRGPRLSILRVPEGKVAKNRLHIDIRVGGTGPDQERWPRIISEAQRLVAAGASMLKEYPMHHVVMADPEGNEFCVA
jgi:hypothetical protein